MPVLHCDPVVVTDQTASSALNDGELRFSSEVQSLLKPSSQLSDSVGAGSADQGVRCSTRNRRSVDSLDLEDSIFGWRDVVMCDY